MTAEPRPPKLRDAERSREAILDAAEGLFSERGYERASLGDIGAAAGVSRGTPSYFFGSKEGLYLAVLERVFARRHEATAKAFEPVHAWCADPSATREDLAAALARATDGYLAFLLATPSFVRLLTREELTGGERSRAAPRAGQALADAFTALHDAQPQGGLTPFEVGEAVLLYVSLTFGPVAHHATLTAAAGRDLRQDGDRRRHVALVVDQTLHLLTGQPASGRTM